MVQILVRCGTDGRLLCRRHAGEAETLVTLEEDLRMGLGLLQVAGFGLLVVVFAVVCS
jgi:hypothetical protein